MTDTTNARRRLEVDWAALKECKAQQVDAWAMLLGTYVRHPDVDEDPPPVRELRSDTARVQAMRHLQRCENELDRLDMLEAIATQLTNPVDIAQSRADLAAMEGSHGPAMQWTRLAHELAADLARAEEEARQAAAAIGSPDTELGRLAQSLLSAPQAVREELARVMLAGSLPDDWRPSEIIRLPVAR
tara:strand:- start:4360 stop:4920 length:561 start_codon:yes stop_codon:yes gene_type:complete